MTALQNAVLDGVRIGVLDLTNVLVVVGVLIETDDSNRLVVSTFEVYQFICLAIDESCDVHLRNFNKGAALVGAVNDTCDGSIKVLGGDFRPFFGVLGVLLEKLDLEEVTVEFQSFLA